MRIKRLQDRVMEAKIHKVELGGKVYEEHYVPCPECQERMQLTHRYFRVGLAGWRAKLHYVCRRHPDQHVGAHKDGAPMGWPADTATRLQRGKAHKAFDALWRGSAARMNRDEAYHWMRKVMDLPEVMAHIGMFTSGQCETLMRKIKEEFGC